MDEEYQLKCDPVTGVYYRVAVDDCSSVSEVQDIEPEDIPDEQIIELCKPIRKTRKRKDR